MYDDTHPHFVLPPRFWFKVSPNADGCWIWNGGRNKDGYGNYEWNGKTVGVHRLVYRSLRGEIDPDLDLDHLCRVRACCNPSHLEPVSTRINILRGEGRAASNARKTHCKSGHEYTFLNTYINPSSGRRVCKQCQKRWVGEYLARKSSQGSR